MCSQYKAESRGDTHPYDNTTSSNQHVEFPTDYELPGQGPVDRVRNHQRHQILQTKST